VTGCLIPAPRSSLDGMDANATKVVKGGPEDLIATAWFGLGFKPAESLILAGLEGPRDRIGVILRADLPAPDASRSRLRNLVRGWIDPITRSRAHGVVAILASDQALHSPPPAIVSVLRREVRAQRLRLLDVIGLTPTGYRSLNCRDHRCCPAEGRPIDEVMASQSAATHVLKGDALAETPEELLRDVRPDPELDPQPGPLAARLRDHPAAAARLPPGQRREWWRHWVEAFANAQAGWPEVGALVPGLSGALHDPFLRDAVQLDLLGAPEPQLQAMLDECYDVGSDSIASGAVTHQRDRARKPPDAGDPDQPPQAHQPDLGDLLARYPDEGRLLRGEAVLAGAARIAAPGDRAPSLAVLALASWYAGRPGRARLLAEQARIDDPAVSLIALVEALLIRRVPPPWAQIGSEG
jgi:hypothetical protein